MYNIVLLCFVVCWALCNVCTRRDLKIILHNVKNVGINRPQECCKNLFIYLFSYIFKSHLSYPLYMFVKSCEFYIV